MCLMSFQDAQVPKRGDSSVPCHIVIAQRSLVDAEESVVILVSFGSLRDLAHLRGLSHLSEHLVWFQHGPSDTVST